MEHRSVWALFRQYWLALVAFVIAGGAVGYGAMLLTTPLYTADTEVFVASTSGESTSDLTQISNYSQEQARNYSALVTREIVLQPVINDLGLDMTVGQLRRKVSTTVPLNTSLISISVTTESSKGSAAIADAIAASLSKQIRVLIPPMEDGNYPTQLKTVEAAIAPVYPSSPNKTLYVGMGLLVGTVMGIGICAAREFLNAKVRSPEQARDVVGSSLLGTIVHDRGASSAFIALQDDELSPRAEEFRQLRTNLRFLHAERSHKAFVVTSSVPGEGKSTVAANIAATVAATGQSVCLVEADLRRPTLGGALGLVGSVGFTTLLAGEAELEDVLQPWGKHGMNVLLAGETPPNPSELLGNARASQILDEIVMRFDVTIIDCPPLIPVTDATILAQHFGGAIFVTGMRRVQVRDVRRALERMALVDAPVLGVVANRAPGSIRGRYQMSYVAPAEKSPRRQRRRRRATATPLEPTVAVRSDVPVVREPHDADTTSERLRAG